MRRRKPVPQAALSVPHLLLQHHCSLLCSPADSSSRTGDRLERMPRRRTLRLPQAMLLLRLRLLRRHAQRLRSRR